MDIVLLVCLVVLLPGYQLWRSRTEAIRPPASRTAKYTSAIAKIGVLTALLAIDWIAAHRPIALLGLDWPWSRGGLIGLGIAGVILIGLAVTSRFRKPSSTAMAEDDAFQRASALFQPQTATEFRLFVAFVLSAGIMWEVLYRGFLLWALEPRIGTIGAIIVAAAAYGSGHGFKSARLFAASLASAFAFTIAYALTRSLWWLMLLHAALPFLGMWIDRARRR